MTRTHTDHAGCRVDGASRGRCLTDFAWTAIEELIAEADNGLHADTTAIAWARQALEQRHEETRR